MLRSHLLCQRPHPLTVSHQTYHSHPLPAGSHLICQRHPHRAVLLVRATMYQRVNLLKGKLYNDYPFNARFWLSRAPPYFLEGSNFEKMNNGNILLFIVIASKSALGKFTRHELIRLDLFLFSQISKRKHGCCVDHTIRAWSRGTWFQHRGWPRLTTRRSADLCKDCVCSWSCGPWWTFTPRWSNLGGQWSITGWRHAWGSSCNTQTL